MCSILKKRKSKQQKVMSRSREVKTKIKGKDSTKFSKIKLRGFDDLLEDRGRLDCSVKASTCLHLILIMKNTY